MATQARLLCCILLLSSAYVGQAGEVNPAALKSSDEITKIHALLAIARAGKNARVPEADIVALMTKSWEGRRLSKWCLHALVSMGVPGDKHMDAFHAVAFWQDKRPPDPEERKRTEPERRKVMEGPDLPEDLKEALPEVWKTVANVVLTGFERGDIKTSYKYRECIQRMRAPNELLVPRLGKFLADQKQDVQLRANAAESIMLLRRGPVSTDALILGLNDSDFRVRRICVNALFSIAYEDDAYGTAKSDFKHPEPEKAIAALEKVVASDSNADVKESATKTIERIKKQKY